MPKEMPISGYTHLRDELRDLREKDHTAMTTAQFRAEIDALIRAVNDLEEDDEGSEEVG